jgi:hypothetical protein
MPVAHYGRVKDANVALGEFHMCSLRFDNADLTLWSDLSRYNKIESFEALANRVSLYSFFACVLNDLVL